MAHSIETGRDLDRTGNPGVRGVGPRTDYAVSSADAAFYARRDARLAFVQGVADLFTRTGPRLARSGGGTFAPDVRRYVVGGYGDAVVIKATATRAEAITTASLFASAVTFTNHGTVGGQLGIGFWVDPATGRVWLDRVRSFDDLGDALKAGRVNGELAIFDTHAHGPGATIPVPGRNDI